MAFDDAKRALLVNDNLFFSAGLIAGLKRAGFRADTVARAVDVASKIRDAKPDILIINLGSNENEGLELIKALKAESEAPYILAFMPHGLLPEKRPTARAAGADRVVANSAIMSRLPLLVNAAIMSLPGVAEMTDDDGEDSDTT